jgi:hypothetical protein
VLLDVLQRAGLTPEAKRGRDGVHVRVPDEQGDQAHQILVANMDVIAQAARNTPDRSARRKARPRRAEQPSRPGGGEPPSLASERLLRSGRPLVLLLIGLMLAALIPPLRLVLIVGTVAAVIYVLGKQTQRDGDDPDRRT